MYITELKYMHTISTYKYLFLRVEYVSGQPFKCRQTFYMLTLIRKNVKEFESLFCI